MRLKVLNGFLFALVLSMLGVGCGPSGSGTDSAAVSPDTLVVLSGSENKSLENLIKGSGVPVKLEYKGSVDIMLELEKGSGTTYDAVWPASSMWLRLGDKQRIVKNDQSIYRTPVVLGVKKSVVKKLGWSGKQVKVADILAAAKSGKLRFMMTSATQSNSGAAFYLGCLYSFAGNPDVLGAQHLKNPKLGENTRQILGGVNRSSGSSGFLAETFVRDVDVFDAMVNYESIIAETNKILSGQGRELLVPIYPVDGLAIADSPLGYIDHGNQAKQAAFQKLQAYLLSPQIQKQLAQLARRTSLGLAGDTNALPASQGFKANLAITPVNIPEPDVMRSALVLYQTAFRKPSLTVFVLDYSGSMEGKGESDLESAMRMLLDQDIASRYMIQAAPRDITIVVPFDGTVRTQSILTCTGNDPAKLRSLWSELQNEDAAGATDCYIALRRAFKEAKRYRFENFSTAVILMTDGRSDGDADLMQQEWQNGTQSVPVYSVMFGDADPTQLKEIATLTSGKVFDGKKDLISAMREAKGYN